MPRPLRLWLLVALAGASPCLAGTGTVLDAEGEPIADARVCHYQARSKIEMLCVVTDAEGNYEILDSEEFLLRVTAAGYFPERVPAEGHQTVTLQRSPALMVRVVDASTGEPLEESEVWVVYPSAKKKGPFPARRGGVKIVRILDPGDVRVVGRAEGYDESEPAAVKLEPGKETEVLLEMRAASKSSDD